MRTTVRKLDPFLARFADCSIDADPHTAWLQGCVALEKSGFVITGEGAFDARSMVPRGLPPEKSMPRLFAISDVRSGSSERVAAAVGEGAAVVARIHGALASS
jgi:thioredoxin reductase (NADPH)